MKKKTVIFIAVLLAVGAILLVVKNLDYLVDRYQWHKADIAAETRHDETLKKFKAENKLSSTINRDIGIICRSDNKYESEKTSFPDKRIDVYDAPCGSVLGTIGRVSRYSLNLIDNNLKSIDIADADKIEIVYEGNVLKYYKEDEEYANILTYTLPEGVWIRKADLNANNFKAQSWLNYLVSSKREYHYQYNNVELRKFPNSDSASDTIASIGGDLDYISFTGKNDGFWAEVVVNRYDKHPSMEDGKIVEKLNGWIRAVDDNGKPRVWYYTRGI